VKVMMFLLLYLDSSLNSYNETQLEAEVDGATSALAQIGQLV
jgi:hypothetical protein